MSGCATCRGRVPALALVPSSLHARQCEACGVYSFDARELTRRQAEVRRSVGPKAMEFGLNQLPWANCVLCNNQRVQPQDGGTAACTACRERYVPLAAHQSLSRAPDEARLFARIAATPDDDAPRNVLADLLLERDEPFGEFMRLQLDEVHLGPRFERAARINALLLRHQWEWVPPGVDASACEFHRGLLRRADWPLSTDPRHELWSTVEELTLPRSLSEPLFPGAHPLTALRPALRKVGRCGPVTRKALLARPPPNLRSLGLFIEPTWMPLLVERLRPVLDALPGLTELDLEWDSWAAPEPEPVVLELVRALGPRLTTLWVPAQALRSRTLLAVSPPGLSLRLSTRADWRRSWIELAGRRVTPVINELTPQPELAQLLHALEQ
ncbi:MAG: TIGR02996 domain-containing protein [Myxococcaceae bacterium]